MPIWHYGFFYLLIIVNPQNPKIFPVGFLQLQDLQLQLPLRTQKRPQPIKIAAVTIIYKVYYQFSFFTSK